MHFSDSVGIVFVLKRKLSLKRTNCTVGYVCAGLIDWKYSIFPHISTPFSSTQQTRTTHLSNVNNSTTACLALRHQSVRATGGRGHGFIVGSLPRWSAGRAHAETAGRQDRWRQATGKTRDPHTPTALNQEWRDHPNIIVDRTHIVNNQLALR